LDRVVATTYVSEGTGQNKEANCLLRHIAVWACCVLTYCASTTLPPTSDNLSPQSVERSIVLYMTEEDKQPSQAKL